MRYGSPRQIKASRSSSVTNLPSPPALDNVQPPSSTSAMNKQIQPVNWSGKSSGKTADGGSHVKPVPQTQNWMLFNSRGIDVDLPSSHGDEKSNANVNNARQKYDTHYNYRDIADGAPEIPRPGSAHFQYFPELSQMHPPKTPPPPPRKDGALRRSTPSTMTSGPSGKQPEMLPGMLSVAEESKRDLTRASLPVRYTGPVSSTDPGKPGGIRRELNGRHSYHSGVFPTSSHQSQHQGGSSSSSSKQLVAPPTSAASAWQTSSSSGRPRAASVQNSTGFKKEFVSNGNASVEERLRNLVLVPGARRNQFGASGAMQNHGVVNGAYSYDDGELLVPPPPKPREESSLEEGESADSITNHAFNGKDDEGFSFKYVPSRPMDKTPATQGAMDLTTHRQHYPQNSRQQQSQELQSSLPKYHPPPQYSGSGRPGPENGEMGGVRQHAGASSGNQTDLRNTWNKMYSRDNRSPSHTTYNSQAKSYGSSPVPQTGYSGHPSQPRTSPTGQSSSTPSQTSSNSPADRTNTQHSLPQRNTLSSFGRSSSPVKNMHQHQNLSGMPNRNASPARGSGRFGNAEHRESPVKFLNGQQSQQQQHSQYSSENRPSRIDSRDSQQQQQMQGHHHHHPHHQQQQQQHQQHPLYANVRDQTQGSPSGQPSRYSTSHSPVRNMPRERTATSSPHHQGGGVDSQRRPSDPIGPGPTNQQTTHRDRPPSVPTDLNQRSESRSTHQHQWDYNNRPKTPTTLSSGGSETRGDSPRHRPTATSHQHLYQPPEYARIDVKAKQQSRAERNLADSKSGTVSRDYYGSSQQKPMLSSLYTSTPHKGAIKVNEQKWKDSLGSDLSIDSSIRSMTPPLPPLSPSNTPPITPPDSPDLGRAFAHGDHPLGYLPTQTPDVVTSASRVGKKKSGRKSHGLSVKSYEGRKWKMTPGKAVHSSRSQNRGTPQGKAGKHYNRHDHLGDIEESPLDDDDDDDEDSNSSYEEESTANISHTAIPNDTTRDETMDRSEVKVIRQQLEGLETMYLEVLKLLGVDQEYAPGSRRSISSASSISRTGPAAYSRARRGHHLHSKHRRELKHVNKRFTRLESHVVTLARSVAHLSSEMRNQGGLQGELEEIRKDIREMKKHRKQAAKGPGALTEWEKFRGWVPSVTNPKRVHKLTKFFGQEPPLLHIFLKRLGYERYIHNFDAEKISMLELPYLNEERLTKIGIPMGPRLRILQESQMCFRQENFDIYIV